jgi:glycosyltransferase involved in cell wall biosynthesis
MPQSSESQSPLVSVIVPAHNAQSFIGEALGSALHQSYSNIEVLVVDDGSQDRTAEIVASIAERDDRVTLFRSANRGVAAARNLAIESARGEYVAPLDADDVWYPDKLRKQVGCLRRADARVGLVYAWSVQVDEQGRLTGACIASAVEGEAYVPLIYSNFVGNASAPLIRRNCLERVGGYCSWYREQGAQGCEDRELYLRLAERYRFRVVPEFLVGYRQVENSMSCDGVAMARAHALLLAAVRRRHPEIPLYVYRWSESRSCWYLGQKLTRCGGHLRALGLLSRAALSDPMLLVNRQLYTLAARNLSALGAKPFRPASVKSVAAPTRRGSGLRDRSCTLADIERRRAARVRLWQRINARRLRGLSGQRLLRQPVEPATGWGIDSATPSEGEPPWHRP